MELPHELTNLLYGIAHQVEIQLETATNVCLGCF